MRKVFAILLALGLLSVGGEVFADVDPATRVHRDAVLYLETNDVGKLRWHTLGSRIQKVWKERRGRSYLRAYTRNLSDSFVRILETGPGPLRHWSEAFEGQLAFALLAPASGEPMWELVARAKGDPAELITRLEASKLKVKKLRDGALYIAPKRQRLQRTVGGLAALDSFKALRKRPDQPGQLAMWFATDRLLAAYGDPKGVQLLTVAGVLPSSAGSALVTIDEKGPTRLDLDVVLPQKRRGLIGALTTTERCDLAWPSSVPELPGEAGHLCASGPALYDAMMAAVKERSFTMYLAFMSQANSLQEPLGVKLRDGLVAALGPFTFYTGGEGKIREAIITGVKNRKVVLTAMRSLGKSVGGRFDDPGEKPALLCIDEAPAATGMPEASPGRPAFCAALGDRLFAVADQEDGLRELVDRSVGQRPPTGLEQMPAAGPLQWTGRLPPHRVNAELRVGKSRMSMRFEMP